MRRLREARKNYLICREPEKTYLICRGAEKNKLFRGKNPTPSVCFSVHPRFVCPDEYLQRQWFFFPILYTCIYYNPLMNPVKFRQDQIQNGRLINIFVCSNWQNIWKFCPSGWISQTPINISSWYSPYTLTTILP